VFERGVEVLFLALDRGELAIEKRAVGRGGNRRGVGLHRLVEAAGPRRLARAADALLDVTELEHLDPLGEIGQRRIGGQRRGERGQRVALAVQGQQRLAAPEQRRHVGVIGGELERAIEMRQRRPGVLARQLDVAERRLRRIKLRRRLQRDRELAFRRLQIAALQKRPAA